MSGSQLSEQAARFQKANERGEGFPKGSKAAVSPRRCSGSDGGNHHALSTLFTAHSSYLNSLHPLLATLALARGTLLHGSDPPMMWMGEAGTYVMRDP